MDAWLQEEPGVRYNPGCRLKSCKDILHRKEGDSMEQ